MTKGECFVAASILTAGALAAQGSAGANKIPISADISDPTLRSLNLEDWEEFRIFYAAVAAASDDETSWPSPKSAASSSPSAPAAGGVGQGQILSELSGALGVTAPALQQVLLKLIGSIPVPGLSSAAPVPPPSVTPSAASK